MKLGLISDTHDFFDPQIPRLFSGVEHILHAGDIGQSSIPRQLASIAPVTAVRGNTDDPGFGYKLTEVADLGGVRFLLQHITNPLSLGEGMRDLIRRLTPQAVLFGHSHKPFDHVVEGIRYINPGYAGKPRFGLPRTVGLAEVVHGKIVSVKFVRL